MTSQQDADPNAVQPPKGESGDVNPAIHTDLATLGEEAVKQYLGDRFEPVAHYAEMLARHGEERGLIGPRELDRLWERHILNSAAVVPFLGSGAIADVGSGAGLPGIVVAAMLPEQEVYLIEPMERRVAWLEEVAREVGLDNVVVRRGRAEEYRGGIEVDAVTARAVAAIDKLVKWCAPLLKEGGHMAFLKGRSAADEIERAKYSLRKARLSAEILTAPTLPGLEATHVVRLQSAERP